MIIVGDKVKRFDGSTIYFVSAIIRAESKFDDDVALLHIHEDDDFLKRTIGGTSEKIKNLEKVN